MTKAFIIERLKRELPTKQMREHWTVFVNGLPENVWIKPTNIHDEKFTMCDTLYHWNLCEKKITPLWNNGSFVGQKIEFRI